MWKAVVIVSVLMFSAAPAHAEQSWFDMALEFIGWGSAAPEAQEEVRQEPVRSPAPTSSTSTTERESAYSNAPAPLPTLLPTITEAVANQVGMDSGTVQAVLGTLFSLAEITLGQERFNQLSNSVPTMESLLDAAPVLSEGSKGFSSLLGQAGKYGSALEGTSQAYSRFSSLGVGVDQIPAYLDATYDYLESQGGRDAAALFNEGVATVLE